MNQPDGGPAGGRVVYVGSERVAAGLGDRLAVPVEQLQRGDSVVDAVEAGDCLVVQHDLPGRSGSAVITETRARVGSLSSVLFATTEPTVSEAAIEAGATPVVDPADPATVAALANRVRDAVESADEHSGAVRLLHETATAFGDCDTRTAVYERTVTAAEEILDLDYCLVDSVADDMLTVEATSSELEPADYDPLPMSNGGLAGEAVLTGESSLVDDVRESAVANGDHGYRSILTVPATDEVLFQAGAEPVGAFDEADRELTELLLSHAAESIERIDTERELRERERFLSTLLDNLPGMVYRCVNDPGWPMTFVSEGSVPLTGYTPDQLVEGDVVWGEDVLAGGDSDRVWETVQAAIDEQEPFEVTYQIETADGQRRWMWEQGRAVDEGGDVVLEGFITDITERKETEAQLREQRERLAAFARIVSHDLRNPLTVATGHLEAARDATTGASEHLDGVKRAHERMDDIVEGVLALARERSSIDDDTPVSLSAVAEDAWDTVDTAAMSLSVSADSTVVYADRSLVRQALENLFRNAREHAGRDVTVSVGALADDEGFFVDDDGPDLPEELCGSAFELGVAGGGTSTGTGLAIVRRVADAHGWSVAHVESEAGGARFEFYTRTE